MHDKLPAKQSKTKKRRKRFGGRQPKGLNIHITDNDLRYFQALEDHGLLPSHYLKCFANHWTSGWGERLMNVYHETPYLDRPDGQDLSRYANCQPAVYQLSKAGRELVEARVHADGPSGPFPHQLMISTITASIALSLPAGYGYVAQERILKRSGNTLAVDTGQGAVIPDALFGIEHPGDGFRFYALEADRATETMKPNKRRHTDIAKKFDAYREIFSSKLFKSQWSIPNLKVITITTAPQRMLNMIEMADDERFIFQCEKHFGRHWRIPPVMSELVTQPYTRKQGPFDILDC